jgi:hypothetical protein
MLTLFSAAAAALSIPADRRTASSSSLRRATVVVRSEPIHDGQRSADETRARGVKVWDNVLPEDGLREDLHEYASNSGSEHRCFTRPLSEANRHNDIELTLDAILTEIEGGIAGKNVVEYWTRQEWRHIEAHADVDENLAKRMDRRHTPKDRSGDDLESKYSTTYQTSYGQRYPTHGHVLYLQVGTDVRGPTCIFPGRSTGGDLLRSVHDLRSDGQVADYHVDDERGVQLSIVPAVPGRLLRFDGRDLHAVPRPTDIWMIPFVKGSPEYEPEEVWGRSVVLFNVWPDNEDPPLDVPLDRNEFWGWEVEDHGATDDRQESQTTGTFCNLFDDWVDVTIDQKETSPPSPGLTDSQSNESVKVWLLGNERRRDHPLRTVSLLSPAKGGRAVREALAEESRVTQLWLRQQ